MNEIFPFMLYAWQNLIWFSTGTWRLLKPPKKTHTQYNPKILCNVNAGGCMSYNPYTDQMNNLVWSIPKLRVKTRTIFTLSGFKISFIDELQIFDHNYIKMTLT